MYTQSEFSDAVYGVVREFRQTGVDPFAVADICSAAERQFGQLQEGAVDAIKKILSRERRQLDIREAGVGGQLWSFGYRPAATSKQLPTPGSPV